MSVFVQTVFYWGNGVDQLTQCSIIALILRSGVMSTDKYGTHYCAS